MEGEADPGSREESMVRRLILLLEDPDAEVRAMAVASLGKWGNRGLVGTLLPCLGDSKKIVRVATRETLDKLQPGWRGGEESLDFLVGLLADLGKYLIAREGDTGLEKDIPPSRQEKRKRRMYSSIDSGGNRKHRPDSWLNDG